MIKTELILNRKKLENDSKVLKDLYNSYNAIVLTSGEDDGVFYVKNFPKHKIYIVNDNDTYKSLTELGFKIRENDVYSGNVLILKTDFGKAYTVKPMESLEIICKNFNVSKEEIVSKNQLKTDKLFIGQQLIIE